jgi:NAD(P)-dependent dehydrogenase (short-subunit alcohol dehydrogenase family)
MSETSVCAIVGVGPGNGAAFARRFASEGHRVALLARTTNFTGKLAEQLKGAVAYPCDVTDASSIAQAFGEIRNRQGEVDTVIYNAGSGVWGTIDDVAPADFEQA